MHTASKIESPWVPDITSLSGGSGQLWMGSAPGQDFPHASWWTICFWHRVSICFVRLIWSSTSGRTYGLNPATRCLPTSGVIAVLLSCTSPHSGVNTTLEPLGKWSLGSSPALQWWACTSVSALGTLYFCYIFHLYLYWAPVGHGALLAVVWMWIEKTKANVAAISTAI